MSDKTPDLGLIPGIISRRQALAGAASAGLTLAASRRALAGSSKSLKIGFVSPRTGALAGFGRTDGYVLDLCRKALGGGLTIGGTNYEVQILDRDTQSDPARASQLAKSLINSDNVDLMLATSTPEVVNPVSDACEGAGVPCLSTIVPWQAWYFGRGAKPGQPSPFKWTYHFSFGTGEFERCYLDEWKGVETNKKIAALYPNDADGNALRKHLIPDLEKAGYEVFDAGPYEDGTSDFSAQISLFKKNKCEIFTGAPLPPDFAAFWRQAAQQGFSKHIKICSAAKVGLFPSEIVALGELGYNLVTGAYWHPVYPYKSILTGVTGPQLADGYEQATGDQWTQQLGASLALIDAGIAALKAASDPGNKEAVAKSLASLKTETMVGKVDFTSGPVPNVSPAPLIGAQWVRAAPGSKFKVDYVTNSNADDPKVPIQRKLVPYHA